MTPQAQALLAEFDAAAKSAQHLETELRRTLSDELARLERERVSAFRRSRLIRILASAGDASAAQDAVIAAQARALASDLGWGDMPSAAQSEILEHMRPLGIAVWQCSCGDNGVSPGNVQGELARFEQWFEAARGKPLYSLFDRYVPEVPVVDF